MSYTLNCQPIYLKKIIITKKFYKMDFSLLLVVCISWLLNHPLPLHCHELRESR